MKSLTRAMSNRSAVATTNRNDRAFRRYVLPAPCRAASLSSAMSSGVQITDSSVEQIDHSPLAINADNVLISRELLTVSSPDNGRYVQPESTGTVLVQTKQGKAT
jgi:hypothetical protein